MYTNAQGERELIAQALLEHNDNFHVLSPGDFDTTAKNKKKGKIPRMIFRWMLTSKKPDLVPFINDFFEQMGLHGPTLQLHPKVSVSVRALVADKAKMEELNREWRYGRHYLKVMKDLLFPDISKDTSPKKGNPSGSSSGGSSKNKHVKPVDKNAYGSHGPSNALRVDDNLLNIMNTRVCTGPEQAKILALTQLGPNAIWITDSKRSVYRLNAMELKHLISIGRTFYRIVARHTPYDPLVSSPNSEVKAALFAVSNDNCGASHVDLAIGSRVRCTQNLATQIGIFNGATGTVIGFAFYREPPQRDEVWPSTESFHLLVNREIPIVFVRMDKYTGIPLSKSDPRVVPFSETTSITTIPAHGNRYNRWQLPLALASAITTTRAQSLTAHDGAVVEPSNASPFTRGLTYVSCSRATDLSKILFTNRLLHCHFESHPEDRKMVSDEYKRLRNAFP